MIEAVEDAGLGEELRATELERHRPAPTGGAMHRGERRPRQRSKDAVVSRAPWRAEIAAGVPCSDRGGTRS